MNINKAILNNYKSIGNAKNVLYIEPNVTAIIGKNESGKSNILEAIGTVPYFGKPNNRYFKNKNRTANNEEVSLVLRLQLNDMEKEKYKFVNCDTELFFSNESTISINGGLSEIIVKDNGLMEKIGYIGKSKDNRDIWDTGNDKNRKKRLMHIISSLKESPTTILLNFKRDIDFLKGRVQQSYDKREEICTTLDEIKSSLSYYYSIIPKIFYRKKDQQLEFSYNFDRIKEILKDRNDIFHRVLLAASVSKDEITRAFEETNEGDKQNIRDEIEEKIERNIGEKFNEFYTQETVKFTPRFGENEIMFRINTDNGKTMLVTERSNGLRWYLSLFIDMMASDFGNSEVLFLLDEPGVHLHVNAQKELLNLFGDLSNRGHKVIYTTHSPSMINGENILNVRAVEKNDSGNTVIYSNGYDQTLSSTSKMETLSPLIKAIGSDLKFNLGPQYEKQNIITEGITDYMYLKALMNYLEFEEPPNIIPSAGVENINRIVSILMGWGCKYKILLDYDPAGRKEYNVLVDKLAPSLKEEISFVNGENEPSLEEMKSSPMTIEDLISYTDFNKLNNTLNENKDNKVLVAKEFYDKSKSGEIYPERETVQSFEKVFKKFDITINEFSLEG